MLIVTDRHTPKDLRLYESLYRPMDRLRKVPAAKIKKSMESIAGWTEKHGDSLALTSWGKDSVVLCQLLYEVRPDTPVVYMRTERSNPDCDLVRDIFLARHKLNYFEESFVYDEVHATDAHWKIIAERHGQHRITGIRNDESRRRLLSYITFGESSKYSCRPLSLWSNAEIFAYIEQNGLPLCPVYGYLGGGRWQREHIRTHSLAGRAGDGIGRTEWEKEYYPDLINILRSGLL